jgi:hypothetical protein
VFEVSPAGEALLKVVQTNQFKASDHLKLRFKRGNDENIKKYLSIKLKESNGSLKQLNEKQMFL